MPRSLREGMIADDDAVPCLFFPWSDGTWLGVTLSSAAAFDEAEERFEALDVVCSRVGRFWATAAWPATFEAAFRGSTYLTLMRILFRRSAGDGSVDLGLVGGLTRWSVNIAFRISTMISCCAAPACTSRLTMTGRSLGRVFS